MADEVLADLRRELEKARETLVAVEKHLARTAEANAALHVAERVMYSPLHAKVAAALTGIDHALERTQQAPGMEPWRELAYVLLDLDRCEHGRHEGDPCSGGGNCHSLSAGNPHLPPGSTIGYSLRRGPIVMPHRDDKHDAANWVPRTGGADHAD